MRKVGKISELLKSVKVKYIIMLCSMKNTVAFV